MWIENSKRTFFIPKFLVHDTLLSNKFLSLSKMTGPLDIQKGNVLKFLCQFCIDSTKEKFFVGV